MNTVTVGRENSQPIELYVEDQGSGATVVLIHGWPLDGRSWEPQIHPLLEAGHRVINYDRRGFGRSSRPSGGYDFDTLASDLDKLLTELDVQDATLVGFSLGTGELARYVGTHGTGRLAGCVFIESLAPSFTKSAENPAGVDEAAVAGVQQAIVADRYAWLTGLIGDFLNLDDYLGSRVSEETVRAIWNAGSEASPIATRACVPGWLDDFSRDIERLRRPHPDPARHRRPDPLDRRPGPAAPRRAARRSLRRDRGRPARHVRHPRRGGQPRADRVPARARRGHGGRIAAPAREHVRGFRRARRRDRSRGTVRARVGGDGPALLLLHGYPQTHLMWHAAAPLLAERFTVVAAELPGYGGSFRPVPAPDHAPHSKRALARDLVAGDGRARPRALRGRRSRPRRPRRLPHGARPSRDASIAAAVLDVVPTGEVWARADAAPRPALLALGVPRPARAAARAADRGRPRRVLRLPRPRGSGSAPRRTATRRS